MGRRADEGSEHGETGTDADELRDQNTENAELAKGTIADSR